MLSLKRSDNVALKQLSSSAMGYKTSFIDWRHLDENIGTQSVQELFFCDSIRRTVYSNDLVKFFWLRYTARKKLGIYDVHTMLHR